MVHPPAPQKLRKNIQITISLISPSWNNVEQMLVEATSSYMKDKKKKKITCNQYDSLIAFYSELFHWMSGEQQVPHSALPQCPIVTL